VPNVENTLNTTKFADTSLPVAIGLLLMMYPVFCRINYDQLNGILK
jgi:ACR3 family arsenite transporter